MLPISRNLNFYPSSHPMNATQPWNLVFLFGFILFSCIRYVFARRRQDGTNVVSRFDRLERLLLATMFAPTVVLPLLYLLTPILAFADYEPPLVVPFLGAALMVVSLWAFWRSHADLGKNWSVSLELREGHELVTHGVYRRIRHPMYAAIWLWSVSQGMLLPNWLAGWSIVPVFAVMYFLRVPREEALMCQSFGDAYREYILRTGRLLPRPS